MVDRRQPRRHPAYTQFPYAFARIVAAIREGYYGYAHRNCPYKFCWRPSRQTVAAGVHHSAFYPGDEAVDLIGMSHHERDPYLTPANWSSRTSTWPAGRSGFTREGWDPFFDFCANRGKQACFPEWGPIEHHPEYEASPHPEEFFRLTRSYIEARCRCSPMSATSTATRRSSPRMPTGAARASTGACGGVRRAEGVRRGKPARIALRHDVRPAA